MGFSWCRVSQEILDLKKLIPLLTTTLGVAPAVTLVICGLDVGFWLLPICAAAFCLDSEFLLVHQLSATLSRLLSFIGHIRKAEDSS